ncbi:MAG TPA: hypothetical protein VFO04_01735, partial [Nitrospira sp.]|nr:hypothetical protein [Nitrospira sp.]
QRNTAFASQIEAEIHGLSAGANRCARQAAKARMRTQTHPQVVGRTGAKVESDTPATGRYEFGR